MLAEKLTNLQGITMERDLVCEWLRNHSYSPEQIITVVSRIQAHGDLWQALCSYVRTGKEPTVAPANGVSYESLRKYRWITPVSALLYLARFRLNPLEAQDYLRRGLRVK